MSSETHQRCKILVRDEVKNNLPILIILFPLLCVEFLLNNPLFLKKFVLIKENININMGRLFFTLSLTHAIKQCVQPQRGVILVKGSICMVTFTNIAPRWGLGFRLFRTCYQYIAPLGRKYPKSTGKCYFF